MSKCSIIKSKDPAILMGTIFFAIISIIMYVGAYYISQELQPSEMGLIWFILAACIIFFIIFLNKNFQEIIINGNNIKVKYGLFIEKDYIDKCSYNEFGYKSMKGKLVSTSTITLRTGVFSLFVNKIDTPNFDALLSYLRRNNINGIDNSEGE